MKQSDKKATADRRSFLKLMGVGTVSAGAALGASSDEVQASTQSEGKSAGYRKTAHVKTYYDLAKF